MAISDQIGQKLRGTFWSFVMYTKMPIFECLFFLAKLGGQNTNIRLNKSKMSWEFCEYECVLILLYF